MKLALSKEEVDSKELEDFIWQFSNQIPSILKPNQKIIVGTKADGSLFTNLRVSPQMSKKCLKICLTV